MPVKLNGAHTTETFILQKLGELRVTQSRLAQVEVEARAKEALHIRERHHGW
jgi:hypothetical protein